MIRHGDWIQTYSGRKFWPLDPRPEDVHYEDIAHALSLVNRFSGHTSRAYTVAEHSIRVADLASLHPEFTWQDQDWGIIHDASEAYIADVSSPLKHSPEMAPYREAEAKVMRAITDYFGLPPEMPESVKWADRVMLAVEARDLMGAHRRPWIWGSIVNVEIPEKYKEPRSLHESPWGQGALSESLTKIMERMKQR